MREKKILGVVPARSGSKGLPGKNLLQIGGISLLGHAVKNAVASQRLSRVICSADHNALIEEAENYGAEVLFKRPAELATDTASSWSVVQHAVNWLEVHESWSPDFIVLLQPTTPFRKSAHIDAALDQMFAQHKQSCISIREVDYPPHWMFYVHSDGTGERLFPDGATITRRQDAPVIWQPNGLIYVVSREMLFAAPVLPKEDSCFYQMPWELSINIDSAWQYELAKILWEKQPNLI